MRPALTGGDCRIVHGIREADVNAAERSVKKSWRLVIVLHSTLCLPDSPTCHEPTITAQSSITTFPCPGVLTDGHRYGHMSYFDEGWRARPEARAVSVEAENKNTPRGRDLRPSKIRYSFLRQVFTTLK